MVDGQPNRIAVIIQARMKSTRLPGKILLPMPMGSDNSILDCIILQLKRSKYPLNIFIATSINPENDALTAIAEKNQVSLYRGSEDDVLSRFIDILSQQSYDIMVRITADNPILDIRILDNALAIHIDSGADYTATKGLPIGMNFELTKANAMLQLAHLNLSDQDKEHVTLKLKNDTSFKCQYLDYQYFKSEQIRVTVDYPVDYLVTSFLFQIAKQYQIEIGMELIEFAKTKYIWLLDTNQMSVQKKVYDNWEDELAVVIPFLKNLDFFKTVNHLEKYI